MRGVTFIRPYADAIRSVVAGALERAGEQSETVFRAPLEHSAITRHLLGDGRDDGLIIPYFRSITTNGVEVLRAYHNLGRPRRILMPTRHALPRIVDEHLRSTLGPQVGARVLVLRVREIEAGIDELRSHFGWPIR